MGSYSRVCSNPLRWLVFSLPVFNMMWHVSILEWLALFHCYSKARQSEHLQMDLLLWTVCDHVLLSHAGRRRLPWDEHRSHKKSLGGFSARILHLRLHWRPSQRLPPEKRRSEAGAAPSITGAETPEEHVQLCTKKTTISYLCLNEF